MKLAFAKAPPAFQTWLAEALKQPWIVEADEIDKVQEPEKANGAS